MAEIKGKSQGRSGMYKKRVFGSHTEAKGGGFTEKILVEPHVPRRGWLKNNNSPGDPNTAPRCGAKTRRFTKCMAPAMKNGRCRLHGGKSTGPITAKGKYQSRIANLIHGHYSKDFLEQRRATRNFLRFAAKFIKSIR